MQLSQDRIDYSLSALRFKVSSLTISCLWSWTITLFLGSWMKKNPWLHYLGSKSHTRHWHQHTLRIIWSSAIDQKPNAYLITSILCHFSFHRTIDTAYGSWSKAQSGIRVQWLRRLGMHWKNQDEFLPDAEAPGRVSIPRAVLKAQSPKLRAHTSPS